MVVLLLSAFAVAAVVSAVVCLIALRLFPWFRSGERKPGAFRPDESAASGAFQFDQLGAHKRTRVRPRSSELPLVGGVAMVVAIVAASWVAGYLLRLSYAQWLLLGILAAATVGYALIGLIDDARKVYRGIGISELQKGVGVVIVSGVAAVALNRLVMGRDVITRLAYPPYNQAPFIGSLLVHQPHAWLVFFVLMTIVVASATSLAVDFSDGMDGLAGGLLLSAGLAYAAILFDEGGSQRWPLVIAALALAGATLGYLPFNWPSSWRGRPNPSGRRWAKLIMGDTGSLALGGLLALIAIVARQELLLVVIGGAFVLEGLSAVISARILVQFYRRFLYVERFQSSRGFPHTEFPLPFLATPMHHHYDLLQVDRKKLVYGAWLLGAGLAVLGIATAVGPFTWERYLGRLAALVVLIAVWQTGPWTKAFFIGLEPPDPRRPQQPRRMTLCYGAPFRLFGLRMYHRVDQVATTNAALVSASERLLIWQRMSVFDARALLGYFCYREANYEDAHRIWDRLPDANVEARPDLEAMVAETTKALAERQGATRPVRRSAHSAASPAPANASAETHPPAPLTDAAGRARPTPTPPGVSHWRNPAPPRLDPLSPPATAPRPQESAGAQPEARLWHADRWVAANGLTGGATTPLQPVTRPFAPADAPDEDDTAHDIAALRATDTRGTEVPTTQAAATAPLTTLAAEGKLAEADSRAMAVHTSYPSAQRASDTGDV